MKKSVILPLYEAPHYAEQVTDWLWQAFGEGLSREFFHSIVVHSQTPDVLPLTFIAVEDERLLGTVGLWRCDLITRQDLFPWLAALYVDDAARGKGLAGKLQQHVIRFAARAGYEELHLWSACRDFYERYGWQYIGDGLEYPDKTVHLYRYSLCASAGAATE
ncbi:GNAT family N-acetyltransferase [Enterobacter cloacae complex sp. P31C]|uniref:GNAT family N-acetyltransferase n=1 Tax=Enterobacter TaxID=547 RepID=UPI00186843B4|nr:GNAT family N-acetyltransferase [Enterobacter cloacae complex sp. P31C]